MPGDKSIAHRALLLGALARGKQRVRGLPEGDDLLATRDVLAALGARLENRGDLWEIEGPLRASGADLACRNSGTTLRLAAGVLAAAGIEGTLTAESGLSKRPMERIAEPLRLMGARVETSGGHPPVRILPGPLHGIDYASPVASAQVKSCVLVAALRARGRTTVREPLRSRDHTERLLEAMGAKIDVDRTSVSLEGGQSLSALEVSVPGDLSSAAFPVLAAILVPGSEVEIENVGLNPTRTGFLEALDAMGAHVEVAVESSSGGEPAGRIVARGGRELQAIEASGEMIVRAIDELPALFAAAAFARGRSVFRDAQELRKKESDRIAAMARGLRALGVSCEEFADGLAIEGDPDRRVPSGARCEGAGDHRIVMALACAALRAAGEVAIEGADAVAKSYPEFFVDLARVVAGESAP
jgi:3-phosphoshikimate 1-carboxyvinyltransferase